MIHKTIKDRSNSNPETIRALMRDLIDRAKLEDFLCLVWEPANGEACHIVFTRADMVEIALLDVLEVLNKGDDPL